jgi:redox-sensitive bicupin YhaK (pirin superfamily)
MIRIRRTGERGHANYGWLDTYHTFSFGSYYDPAHTNFRSLRVMNEDRVAPGKGFGTHPHDNMEIVTYVLQGALEHKDSMGNGAVLRPGEFQRMSAGTGITHSEFNPSPSESVHLYQIWLMPAVRNVTPSYEQREFARSERINALQLVAAPDGRSGSLTINQDVQIFLAEIDPGRAVEHTISAGRHAWVQVLRGSIGINGQELAVGDGAALSSEDRVVVSGIAQSEVMIFDLA